MKKAILALLLAAMSTGAMAEWVKYGETDIAVFYMDPATIRKDGNFRKVWLMQDHKQRTKEGVMSLRSLEEYDCKEERRRGLSISGHFGPMLSGEIFGSDSTPDQWTYIPPGTLSAKTLKLVCDR